MEKESSPRRRFVLSMPICCSTVTSRVGVALFAGCGERCHGLWATLVSCDEGLQWGYRTAGVKLIVVS